MAGNIVVSQINGGSIGVINAIINGNFQVNQRAVSGTVTLAAGAYGHDRWKAGASGCTYTFATANNITTLTISAGSLIQVIEGNNLFTGTYTLSWTGTAQGKIGGGSYASSGVTGTPAGGSDLNIEFNTGTLSLVQFEPGSVATPFERRPYGTELQLAQRYFETTLTVAPADNMAIVEVGALAQSDGSSGATFQYMVRKRATPTMVIYAPLTTSPAGKIRNGNSGAIASIGSSLITASAAVFGTGTTASNYIQFGYAISAEL